MVDSFQMKRNVVLSHPCDILVCARTATRIPAHCDVYIFRNIELQLPTDGQSWGRIGHLVEASG